MVFVIVVYFWRSHDASNTSLPEPKDTKEILNNDILLELKGKSFVQTIACIHNVILLEFSNFLDMYSLLHYLNQILLLFRYVRVITFIKCFALHDPIILSHLDS